MSQRGGSVLSTVRFGEHVWSPVSRHADVVIATELLEGHRGLGLLGPQGTLVCAVTTRIVPGQRAAPRGGVPRRSRRPPPRRAACASSPSTPRTWRAQAGTVRAVNVALLGAASAVLPFSRRRRGSAASRPPCRPRSWKSTSGRSPSGAAPSAARRSGREGHAAHRVSRESQRASRRGRRPSRQRGHQHPRVLHHGGRRVRHRAAHRHRPRRRRGRCCTTPASRRTSRR